MCIFVIGMKALLRHREILDIVGKRPGIAISLIKELMANQVSVPTLNRDLAYLSETGALMRYGLGRNTRYTLSAGAWVVNEALAETYFAQGAHERMGQTTFNPDVFKTLGTISIFTDAELERLNALQTRHAKKVATISPVLFKKETERLTIELSWKSSQIEGNTYSLLETEVLFNDHLPARGKAKEEAIMLLNHKLALEYVYSGRIKVKPLRVADVEGLHSLLTKSLGVARNIRKRAVGISGTTYRPPDNEFQVREYLDKACKLINARKNVFEKALLAVLFISYIQPFEDGNKRTGRILGNALLIKDGFCPLSYRSVTPTDYKKAMVLFYEQNNIVAYKKLFLDQYEFAINNYY